MRAVVSLSHPPLNLKPKPQIELQRLPVVLPDDERHAREVLLHKRIMEQGPDNTPPAPSRV